MSEPHGVVQLREEIELAIAGALEAAGGQAHVGELECAICLRPALRPTKTPCGHIFHRHCLEGALRTGRRCPTCREEFPADDAKVFLSCRTLNAIGGHVRVRCPQGCGADEMPFGALAAHIGPGGDCLLTPIRCKNDGCDLVNKRRDAQRHHADCPHRLDPCPQCNAQIPHRDLQNHIANLCENRRVPCQHCAEQIVFSKQRQHLREECTAPVPMKHYVQLQEQQEQQEHRLAEQAQRLAALEQLMAELLSAQRREQEQRAAEQHRQRLEAEVREETAARDRIAGEWGAERGALPADLRRALAPLEPPRTLCTAVQPAAAQNYQYGYFFDLQSKARPVAVSALWIAHRQAAERHDWSVWTRAAAGTCRDQLGRGGWEQLCGGSFAGEAKELHRCPFGRAVTVAAGGTQAFYVHCSSGSYVVFTDTQAHGYAPSADEEVALRPGMHSASATAFESIQQQYHGRYDFVGRVEYRVTE